MGLKRYNENYTREAEEKNEAVYWIANWEP